MGRRRPGRVAGDRVVRPGSAYDALIGPCIECRADDRDGLISAPRRSPGPRTVPPIPAIASQNAPAPIPSSNRPPLMTSRDAAAFASI